MKLVAINVINLMMPFKIKRTDRTDKHFISLPEQTCYYKFYFMQIIIISAYFKIYLYGCCRQKLAILVFIPLAIT